jgi:hypothetical protein
MWVTSPFQHQHLGWYHRGNCCELLTDRLTAQWHRDFLKTVLPGLLEDVPLAYDAEVVASAGQSSRALWGRCQAAVECDMSGKVDWTWRADCMASPVTEDSFLLRQLKKNVYKIPCSLLPSALKWMEATFNTCCNYETPMVSSFYTLHHLKVIYILKTKCHRTYVVWDYLTFF